MTAWWTRGGRTRAPAAPGGHGRCFPSLHHSHGEPVGKQAGGPGFQRTPHNTRAGLQSPGAGREPVGGAPEISSELEDARPGQDRPTEYRRETVGGKGERRAAQPLRGGGNGSREGRRGTEAASREPGIGGSARARGRGSRVRTACSVPGGPPCCAHPRAGPFPEPPLQPQIRHREGRARSLEGEGRPGPLPGAQEHSPGLRRTPSPSLGPAGTPGAAAPSQGPRRRLSSCCVTGALLACCGDCPDLGVPQALRRFA